MTPHRCIDACNLRVRAKKLTRRDLFVSFRAGNKIFRKGTRWRSREQGEWTDSPEKARVADAAPRAVGARDRRVTHRTTNESRERTTGRPNTRSFRSPRGNQTNPTRLDARTRDDIPKKKHALLHSR